MPMIWDASVKLFDQLPRLPSHYSQWEPPQTPLSTYSSTFAAMVTYLAVIFGGQRIMADRKPMQLRPMFMLHNLLLSLGSLWLLVLMVEQVAPIVINHGFFYAICHVNAWTPQLVTLYMVNYYFKYWELLDTCFLVAKKKSLQFLHVFHHTATAVLCFTQLGGKTSVSWVPIVANLTVHVIMYYYYFTTAAFPGYKPWYKKALTSLQISQFVIDLFIVYFASYSYFAAEYGDWPTMGTCTGSEGAALFGCALLTSYLFLFIAFYRKTYKQDMMRKKTASKTIT
ncbi:ELO family [Phakopsora pachyrhizi]|uniref:Elongation of fatty acids protein n=1 Tax=Phakopsora pachyrhizi TaxID=170000 RepID=A0AAV0BAV3_PHAPC|nr:ELO family [Phakopsora pachyrhizi]CAH7683720.1 ELO family [Phakopsora pachyrhizi]CAH7684326.1 ELO family [Phakopsora pachyrhizi]